MKPLKDEIIDAEASLPAFRGITRASARALP